MGTPCLKIWINHVTKILNCTFPPYHTRFAESNNMIIVGLQVDPNLKLTEKSFRWRGPNLWNRLPKIIQTAPNVKLFKAKVRVWILEKIPI